MSNRTIKFAGSLIGIAGLGLVWHGVGFLAALGLFLFALGHNMEKHYP